MKNLGLVVLETVESLTLEKTTMRRAGVQLRRAKDVCTGTTTVVVNVVRNPGATQTILAER